MARESEYRNIRETASPNIYNNDLQRSMLAICNIIFLVVWSIVNYAMIFKRRGRKMGVFEGGGGGGGGGFDLAIDFKNFWDGVYNFFFLPPPPPPAQDIKKFLTEKVRVIKDLKAMVV